MNPVLQALVSFTRRYPMVVLGLATFVLLGVSDYFLYRRYGEIVRRHDRVVLETSEGLLALSSQPRLAAELATVNGALQHITDNLIAESDLAGNSDYFYQLEKSTGVHLGDLNQLNSPPPADDSPYRVVPFSLRLSGSYEQVLAFVRGLENGPRLLRVRRFSFARGAVAADSVDLDLNVEVLARL